MIWSSASAIWITCGSANDDANWSAENVYHRHYPGAWDCVRAARSVCHVAAVVCHPHLCHRLRIAWHVHRLAQWSWRNHHDCCDIVAYSARCSCCVDAQTVDPVGAPATAKCCWHANASCDDADCCAPRIARSCANENVPLASLCLRFGICKGIK